MKKELLQELLQSVNEMKTIRGGRAKPSRVFKVEDSTDVSRVRSQLGLSQQKFAQLLGISEKTLQNWEQGRRRPTGPARVLLRVAARHPEAILEAA
ncbi:MAG: helix-turn-helix domain-containing protein [Chthoniobacter sp.]|uniref:helix-turn-helix domain-containing protein n=1 Tax=Chthoniobacter sp. TaxID=2510640 RepID=UPI0032A15C4A